MVVFLRALKCLSPLLVCALFGDCVVWTFWNGQRWFPTDWTWLEFLFWVLNAILCSAGRHTSACLCCFAWDTQTSVDMVDRWIEKIEACVLQLAKSVFQLRATRDIRSQLGKKLASALFTWILQFVGRMLKIRSYYRKPTCIKKVIAFILQLLPYSCVCK